MHVPCAFVLLVAIAIVAIAASGGWSSGWLGSGEKTATGDPPPPVEPALFDVTAPTLIVADEVSVAGVPGQFQEQARSVGQQVQADLVTRLSKRSAAKGRALVTLAERETRGREPPPEPPHPVWRLSVSMRNFDVERLQPSEGDPTAFAWCRAQVDLSASRLDGGVFRPIWRGSYAVQATTRQGESNAAALVGDLVRQLEGDATFPSFDGEP